VEARPILIARPDGRPAASATVFVLGPKHAAQILNGRVHPSLVASLPSASASPDGILTLPTTDPTEELLIYEDAGYARTLHTAAAAAGKITLTPWARIEGTARRGARPAANIAISTAYPDEIHKRPFDGRYFAYNHVTADPDGHFVLERVFGGKIQISAVVPKPPEDGITSEISVAVDIATLAPGATATVSLGGTGRPVSGVITLPRELQHTPHSRARVYLQRVLSAAATDSARCNADTFDALVADDGTFLAENAPAGAYTLTAYIDAIRPATPDRPRRRETVAHGEKQITLPPIPSGVTDECLNVGPLALRYLPPE
jgi:hypothetical protein